MRFGSVCSGIEAASVAWHPLGWTAAWLSEIEPFPCAVLKHHYPDVPNHGDMTLLPEKILSGQVEAPDLFCGGTPCQAFSVAGLRNSLDDARGNLSLTFVGIANAIDHVRSVRRDAPAIIFWENVPGVLNTKDNAFGCFLGALAGETEQIVPPGDKWTNSGCVFGPQRTVAWRVLDAQYFGVAQRRRRVFVVASARDDINPAEVLFEFEGLRRDSAPSREKRESSAASFRSGVAEVCPTIGCELAKQVNNQMVGNAEAFYIPEPIAFESSRRDGARLYDDVSNTLQAFAGTGGGNGPMVSQPTYAIQGSMIGRSDNAGPQGDGINVEVCFTQNTIDRHAVAQPINFGAQMSVPQVDFDLCQTLQAKNPMAVAQPMCFDTYNQTVSDVSQTIKSPVGGANESIGTVLAPSLTTNNPSRSPQSSEVTQQVNAVYQTSMAVRRLTPVECERLQGFPDGYTNIPWRKAAESPDGPRYKALGNSWAVPVVRWIGKRIQERITT